MVLKLYHKVRVREKSSAHSRSLSEKCWIFLLLLDCHDLANVTYVHVGTLPSSVLVTLALFARSVIQSATPVSILPSKINISLPHYQTQNKIAAGHPSLSPYHGHFVTTMYQISFPWLFHECYHPASELIVVMQIGVYMLASYFHSLLFLRGLNANPSQPTR
ncbi:hypothetical protein P692DRAFT_20828160 [Suillus brevipes Sb2]|nr:hypothetical protein P692DRAFT_20828160 [Suillus brevipes Sb2]